MRGNPRATASVCVGLLAVLVVPAGVVLANYSAQITLVGATIVAAPLGVVLGLYAVVLARRARETLERTLGRGGGGGAARVGRALGLLGFCLSLTGCLALVFYGLLTHFAGG